MSTYRELFAHMAAFINLVALAMLLVSIFNPQAMTAAAVAWFGSAFSYAYLRYPAPEQGPAE